MREKIKKILLGFLVVTLIAPTLFFERPQKAEALASLAACISAKAIAGATAAATAALPAVLAVSVSNVTDTVIQAKGPAGTDWATCFLRGIAKIIAKTLLHTFTQSVITWINSGFEGSPSFVTNPEGFLNDVADQAIGRVIEDISPFLCAPFRFDIRIALGLNLSLNTKEEVHCRLSDVISNMQGSFDGFAQGAMGSGNLSNWIHIAGTQQNNPYGAYIATTNKIGVGITTATGRQIKLLDWGKGFKSWRSCERWAPDIIDPVTGNRRKGPCIKEGPIKTPGSIIEGQTTGALATTFHELELADEIDEVVGALINQLLVKVMTGAAGLRGANRGDSGSGGMSSVDALLTDPGTALAGSNARPPDGIDCNLRYYPSTKEKPGEPGVYVADDTNDQVWTDNLGVGRTVGVDATSPTIVHAKYLIAGYPVDIEKPVTQTWAKYFEAIQTGCSNRYGGFVVDASNQALGTLAGAGAGEGGLSPTPPPDANTRTVTGNIALNKLADQISIQGNDILQAGPQNLVNGNLTGNPTYGSAYTNNDFITRDVGALKWFQIDLQTYGNTFGGGRTNQGILTNTQISEIKIYGMDGGGYGSETGGYKQLSEQPKPFRLYITNSDNSNLSEDGKLALAVNGVVHQGSYYLEQANGKNNLLREIKNGNDTLIHSIRFDPPISGRYVYILQNSALKNLPFGLAEVEVFGTQTQTDSANSGDGTVDASFAFTVSPAKTTATSPSANSIFAPWISSFNPNKNGTGITLRARFYECSQTTPANCNGEDVDYNMNTPTLFTNNFHSLTFTYSIGSRSYTKSAVEPTESGYAYRTTQEYPENGVITGPFSATDNRQTDVFFARDLSVNRGEQLTVNVTGSLGVSHKPFRLVITAMQIIGNTPTPVGSAIIDFTP